ncbi:MAG: hypothetical protein ACLP0J_01770 [Solirubrobacteraceae bacterium]
MGSSTARSGCCAATAAWSAVRPTPARALSDEAPRFSRDGRWILFVRTHMVLAGESGLSRDTLELAQTCGVGGIVPIIDFTSDDGGFYDHFRWADEIAWYQPR